MNREIQARVLLGGQVTGFKGKYPGLLEEALLALNSGLPLYLIGGLGGCTRVIIEAIHGRRTDPLTEAFQASKDPQYTALIQRFAEEANCERTTSIDYDAAFQILRSKGVPGLNNGLTHEENEILFETKNLAQVVYFLLKGMTTRLR
jgi:hypothetical protein